MKCMVAIAMFGACMHAIPLTPREQCATQGMALSGITMTSDAASGVAVGRGGVVVGTATINGQSVSCRPPQTAADICDVRGAAAALLVKAGYEPGFRNALLGLGYVAFLLPGLILYGVLAPERDATIDEATSADSEAVRICGGGAPRAINDEPGRWCFVVRLDRECVDGRARCDADRKAALRAGQPAGACEKE